MPVYEIRKSTPPLPENKTAERTDVDPVVHVSPLERVGRFKREWQKRDENRKQRNFIWLSTEEEKDIRRLIDQVNEDLEKHDVLVHLSLVRGENGHTIAVYDCTNEQYCTIIRDLIIDFDELPVLLRNLHQETGFIVDVIS